jgi:hypothetical protein
LFSFSCGPEKRKVYLIGSRNNSHDHNTIDRDDDGLGELGSWDVCERCYFLRGVGRGVVVVTYLTL